MVAFTYHCWSERTDTGWTVTTTTPFSRDIYKVVDSANSDDCGTEGHAATFLNGAAFECDICAADLGQALWEERQEFLEAVRVTWDKPCEEQPTSGERSPLNHATRARPPPSSGCLLCNHRPCSHTADGFLTELRNEL